MFLTVVFEVADDLSPALANAAERMIAHHAFAQQQQIKHWSFDQEMRPVSATLTDTPPDLTGN